MRRGTSNVCLGPPMCLCRMLDLSTASLRLSGWELFPLHFRKRIPFTLDGFEIRQTSILYSNCLYAPNNSQSVVAFPSESTD